MSEQSSAHPGIDLEQFDNWDFGQQIAGLSAHAGHRESELFKYRRLVEHLRTKSRTGKSDGELYKLAVSHLSVDELTHLDLVAIGRNLREPITHADSFFRSITVRRRKKQLGTVPEKYLGIGKDKDQLFAEALGIRMPTTFYTGTFDAIPRDLRANVLLKPLISSGSKGAFYIFDETNIHSIQHSKILTSWDELSDAVVAQFGADSLDERVWQVQELVYERDDQPARDLKFYAFYGKIGLIQEVVRHPSMQYEYFNEDLTVAICGREHEPRFQDKSMTTTDKGGLSSEKMKTVRWISEQIPAPFMRIDFVNAESELVFLEFSAAPGMSHTLNDAYDKLLGKHYNEAEIRLVNDLLSRKQFEGFHEFSRRLESERANEVLKSRKPPRTANDGRVSEQKAITATIAGRVQGVGYRDAAVHIAEELGLVGWVKNAPDGSVETRAQGSESVLEQYIAFLGQGSRSALVESVDVRSAAPDSSLHGFVAHS